MTVTLFYRFGDLYLSKSLHFKKISLFPSRHFEQLKKYTTKTFCEDLLSIEDVY